MFSEPTINQLSLVISQAMAPAFLLVAVASFLSVLINHMGRIVDRSRMINAIPDEDIKKAHLKAALPQLHTRATIVNRAIFYAVGSGIVTCLLMIIAFASAYFGVRHEPAAAILFALSLSLFTGALVSFAREVRVAVNDLEFR